MATNKNITMKQFNGTDYDTLYPKTIASQVDGIFQILVTTLPNTEVTASLNGKTVSAMSDSSGLAVLKITGYGTWAVSATVGGIFTSIDCEIKAAAQYEVILFPDLETASWDVISSVSESGFAPSLLSVGDKKTVTINGVNYQAQIIGFNHDTKTSGGTAGITFQLVNCLNTKYQMETSSGASDGWDKCFMRNTTLNSTIYGQLSSDLKAVIKAVNKITYVKTGAHAMNLITTSDKLFLLSEIEVFGSTTYSASGEGKQYEYYAAGNSKIKTVSGSTSNWWERSLFKNSPDRYCIVNGDKPQVEFANESLGVSFAFCV